MGLSVEIPSTKDLAVEKGKANTMRRDFEDNNSMINDIPPPPISEKNLSSEKSDSESVANTEKK